MDARPPSIDIFIAANPKFRAIGKAAIAATLIPLEQRQHVLDGPNPADDWYRSFFSRIIYGQTVDDVFSNRFSIVTFNFDRSFEFAFANWLLAAFPIDHVEAAEQARRLNVVHVNGQLGGCLWLQQGNDARAYDPSVTPDYLKRIADSLHIIGDEGNEAAAGRVRALMRDAERVFILGFGYHDANIEWLVANDLMLGSSGHSPAFDKLTESSSGRGSSLRRRYIFGTFHGMPAGRSVVVQQRYHVLPVDGTCQSLIDTCPEFWKPSSLERTDDET